MLAACAHVPVTTPRLWHRAPRMSMNRDAPLFTRWSALPAHLGWIAELLRHVNDHGTRRIAAALAPLVGDMLSCGALVLTAGVWSGPLAAQLGLRVPLDSEGG